ncbi:MAG: HAMP domain-containing histidine kinase, partial [Phycisphaerales bacterium]|nr:HAMP domain-containing histidine kinase [Phycisphaerales bacterium]
AVTHELRTPLASIRLMAETLERRLADQPGARDYPRRIVRAADGLSFLVDNILSFNRLEKERFRPTLEAVDLAELVRPIVAELAEDAPRTLVVDVDGLAGVRVRGDRELLRLLFGNLARNAVHYNDREPIRVRFEAERAGAAWTVRVTDNGWGIPEVDRRRVFDDFTRAPRPEHEAVAGTGLGLAICRRVARLHGGTIRVVASSPQGTTFAVCLGAADREAGP